jgi:16S rRNA (cytidine1402-2'-O)-methyltransferase
MGRLILVPTPIGNLEDITERAVRILKTADLVYAEDTRTSGFLMKHIGSTVPLRAFHKDNEHRILEQTVEEIQNRDLVALISDAGTPAISDPGFLLVRACIEAGVELEVLPGATALIPALVLSGFPSDRFIFEGFLPHKKGRQKRWGELATEERTMIFYESPHRIQKFTEEALDYLGPERRLVIVRELTKKFEEVIRGTTQELKELLQAKQLKGEIVVVVEGK